MWISNADLNVLRKLKHNAPAKKYYETLGVTENCEDETLRLAFVYLAKRFHPDSGTSEASSVRFSEIESAYREIKKIRNKEKEQNERSPEVEEFDIKHTAPQHRHYLTYDVGIGTPSKRQRLYTIERAQKAVDNVLEHRLKKLQAEERNTLIGKDKQRARDIKTRYGMDRLVEDLIQEAMNKGEFSQLSGMGKPLKNIESGRNPYVDFVTHKLNQVLIENGFTPEWIQLSKEIREETQDLRDRLAVARNKIGSIPLTPKDALSWKNTVDGFSTLLKQINNKIDKYNLLVPILQKQMLHVKLETLAEEALSVPPTEPIKESTNVKNVTYSSTSGILDYVNELFNRKNT